MEGDMVGVLKLHTDYSDDGRLIITILWPIWCNMMMTHKDALVKYESAEGLLVIIDIIYTPQAYSSPLKHLTNSSPSAEKLMILMSHSSNHFRIILGT